MIRIAAAHLAMIREQAREAYPRECCGLLGGHGGEHGSDTHVTCVVAAPNVARAKDGSPAVDRFEIDPKARFDFMRALQECGGKTRMIGHYHSHPDHPPRPSTRDIDMAFEADLIWLIVGVDAQGTVVPAAFRIDRETRHVDPLDIATDSL